MTGLASDLAEGAWSLTGPCLFSASLTTISMTGVYKQSQRKSRWPSGATANGTTTPQPTHLDSDRLSTVHDRDKPVIGDQKEVFRVRPLTDGLSEHPNCRRCLGGKLPHGLVQLGVVHVITIPVIQQLPPGLPLRLRTES